MFLNSISHYGEQKHLRNQTQTKSVIMKLDDVASATCHSHVLILALNAVFLFAGVAVAVCYNIENFKTKHLNINFQNVEI